jgi:hypothetical protein
MSEDESQTLWLPASALSHQTVAEIPPGSLVLGKSERRFATPSLGLRFDANGFHFLLALTPFNDGRSPAGSAIDFTNQTASGYRVTVPIAIEADLAAPVRRYDDEAARIGALVAGSEGPGLVTLFRPPAGFVRKGAVSVTNWGPLADDKLEVEFTGWRLVVRLPDQSPVIFRPFRQPDPDAAPSTP